MYAIIETGGKQYKVQKNDILAVEKLSAKGGEKVQFNTVLLPGGEQVKVGDPLVKGAARRPPPPRAPPSDVARAARPGRPQRR